MGISRGHVSVGRRLSPGSANGRRYSAISSSESLRSMAPWQDLLNEEVVLEDHLLAGIGTQRLQDWAHSELVPVVPILPPHHRLHIRDALHGIAVAIGPVEAESRSPVMDD